MGTLHFEDLGCSCCSARLMGVCHFPFGNNSCLSLADPSDPEAVLRSSEAKRLGRKVGEPSGLAFEGLKTLKAMAWFSKCFS